MLLLIKEETQLTTSSNFKFYPQNMLANPDTIEGTNVPEWAMYLSNNVDDSQ